MRVLALDTTTRAGSAALVEDDRIVDERSGDGARTHALRLPGELLTLVDAHGWPLSAIDLYAVASGPGSFTGLRIGIATIQGLAFVHGKRIVAVPVLDALAHAAAADRAEGTMIAAWMDAHRGDVFASLHRVAASPASGMTHLIEIEGPTVGSPAETLARWKRLAEPPQEFIGDGAILSAAQITAASGKTPILQLPLLAGIIGRLAQSRLSEALDPESVRPFYVRRPALAIARDQTIRRPE